MEMLVKDAKVDIDIKQENAELPSTSAQNTSSFEFKLKGMENKTRVSLNTSALGNKIAAFHHILRLSEAMGAGFVQYVPLVLPVLKGHINHFSKAIRKSSLKTLHHIMTDQGEPQNL